MQFLLLILSAVFLYLTYLVAKDNYKNEQLNIKYYIIALFIESFIFFIISTLFILNRIQAIDV